MKNDLEVNNARTIDEKVLAKKQEKRPRAMVKILVFNAANIVLIVAIFYFLSNLTGLGEKVKELRSLAIAAEETNNASVLVAEVDRNKEALDKLNALFISDEGFLSFVVEMDKLKQEGVIIELTFPGGTAVTNKDGQSGLPVQIVFQGSKDQVNAALSRVFALPFFLLPTNVEFVNNGEVVHMRFAAFLLVDDNFSQN